MQFNSKKMIILQKQLKLKLKFRPFALSVLALCFLFLSSTLLAHNYADIGEYLLRHRVGLAGYFRTNSQPFTPAFSASLQPEILEIPGIPELFGNSAWHFRANATNNSANDPSINSINLAYQYEDQDMDTLLRLRFQEVVGELETETAAASETETAAGAGAEAVNLEDIIILPPLSDNREGLITQLREEAERYNNDVASGVMNPHERTILLALNINQSHWVGIVIKLNNESGVISITYTDPAGYYGVPEHIRLLLQEVYGEDINIEVIPGLIQRDDTGCGPLVVENLIRETRGIRGDHYVPRELMRRIRAHHVNLLETRRPDLGFRKRQQNNVRSFNDIDNNLIGPLVLSGSKGSQDYDACLKLGLTPAICGGGNTIGAMIRKEYKELPNNGQPQNPGGNQTSTNDEQFSLFDRLPDELKLEILDHMKPRDLSKAALVSKEWNRIAKDNVLWLHKTQDEFSPSIVEKAIDIYDESILAPDNGLISNTNGQTEVMAVETEKDKKAKEDQNKQSERDFKKIYRIGRLLANKSTRLALYRERGILIEVNDRTPNFSIQKLFEDISSLNSIAKALVIRNIVISVNNAHHLANALKNENCGITELYLQNNQIDVAGALAIADALKDPNCKVISLDLSHNQIGVAGALAIADALINENCKVTELNLYGNQIGAAGTIAIAKALKHPNCKVTELYLGDNQIGDDGAEKLAEALKDESCKVTGLNLFANQIGVAGSIAIAKALKHPNCKLTELNLFANQIGVAGAIAIAKALKHPNCKLTELNLNSNQIGVAGAQAIADALINENCKLTKLDLVGNQIDDAGAQAIADALINENCKLTALNLGINQIGDDKAQAIAAALKDPSCKVTTLSLCNNKIGHAGAQAIADALKNKNSKVTKLYLSGNQIGFVGARVIADALKNKNCKLTELDLYDNQIGAAGAQAIADALKNKNSKLTTLNLYGNQIGAAGAQAIADALKNKNCKVTTLNLYGNQIGVAGAQAIADALENENCKVTGLYLSRNQIGVAGAQAIADALKNKNCKVTELYLGDNQIVVAGAEKLAEAVVSLENQLPQGRIVKISGVDGFEKMLVEAR